MTLPVEHVIYPRMSRTCPDHPGYATGRPPTRDCITCWAAYGRRRAIDDGLRSQGRAKGGGQSSKAKGRAAVVLLRDALIAASGLHPDDFLVKATSMGGVDLHLSPRARELFPYGIEVKAAEGLNVWAALKQAASNAGKTTPLLVFKRAGTQLYAALRLTDFLNLHTWPNPSPSTLTAPTLMPDAPKL